MPRSIALAVALLGLAGVADAQTHALYGLFSFDETPPPIAGDCGAIAAQIGPEATWYGEYSGKFQDEFTDRYQPISLRGCFPSEFECRRWQNQAMTYGEAGPTYYARCRQGVPARLLR